MEKLANLQLLVESPVRDHQVEQRHGMVPAVERESILRNIEDWGQVMEENIDLDALIAIMKEAENLPEGREPLFNKESKGNLKIGVAKDEVFTFYYQDNLESLEANNADLVYFSPLNDDEVPDVDAVYIGGGYPEIFGKELAANYSMRTSLKKFHKDNRPIYAECGGLMYLTRSINHHEMCDVFPYPSHMTKKPQALSYVIARAAHDNIIIPEGEIFHGHEFHYSQLELGNSKPKFAFNIMRGRGVIDSMDGLMSKNTLASYVPTHVAACQPSPLNW